MIRTLRIRTDLNVNDFLPLMKQCSEIFNIHANWAVENKTHSKTEAHKSLYHNLCKQYPEVPTNFIQTSRDLALEAVKAKKTNERKNKKKRTFKTPHKKETSGIRYNKNLITLRGNIITLSCISKRKKTTVNVPEYFAHIFATWKFANATLTFNQKEHTLWLNLTFKTDSPELLSFTNESVQGIDRGLYNLAVTSNGQVFSNNKIRAARRRYSFNRRKLQTKGTPSAKRHLQRLSGKEKRFSREVNHVITKKLVDQNNVNVFVLEDLSGIRNQRKGKTLNRHLGSWPFYQFEQFLIYKADALGKQVVYVNPSYTSQCCSCCGCVDKMSRNKSHFHCTQCGHKSHADVNAAVNIRDRYIYSVMQEKASTEQALVNTPIVTSSS